MGSSHHALSIKKIQRGDLNPIDVAKALQRLIKEFGYLQEEVAKKIGKKRSTVTNYLRLLSLPKQIQEGISIGKITLGHAKALLSLEKTEKQLYLFELIVMEQLSVREAEKAAQKIDQLPKKREANSLSKDCFIKELENRLLERFGTKVAVQDEGNKGRLCIEYYDLEDLERLLELCGVTGQYTRQQDKRAHDNQDNHTI
ncbi:MAG TPA: ParB/RepB/Spo0J family partition protein [Waddliaceae bacterium]